MAAYRGAPLTRLRGGRHEASSVPAGSGRRPPPRPQSPARHRAVACRRLKWRLTSSFPKSLDTIYGASEVFAKAVAEATDNKFQIQVFAAGEIVPGLQAADAVQNGTVEMCHTASYYYFGKDPTFAFGTAVPFGLNSRMQTAWMYFGGGMELMNDFYKKFNIYGIPAGNTGARWAAGSARRSRRPPISTGSKMRIGGFAGRVLSKLGVVPQQIAGGDIYPALEKGTLDACEWVGPYDDEKLGFQKVAQYYYYPGWWEGGAMLHNFINLDKWNALPPAYKSLVRTASSMANEWMQAKYDAAQSAGAQAAGGGRRAAATVLAAGHGRLACKRRSSSTPKSAKTNADFKKVWDAMLAFRNDEYLWWQVAELTYDTYLVRNRTRT